MILVAKRIAGRDVFDSDDGRDVARVTRLDVFALVGLNLDKPCDALAFVRPRVVNRVALRKRAGVDAEENELADEWITPKFEGERTELAVVVGRGVHRFERIGVLTFRAAECRADWEDNRPPHRPGTARRCS